MRERERTYEVCLGDIRVDTVKLVRALHHGVDERGRDSENVIGSVLQGLEEVVVGTV